MRAFFPNMRIEELDAGHWGMFFLLKKKALNPVAEFWCSIVHAEKPNEFRKLVVDFLSS